jgi:hypothetical protein
MYEFPKPGAEQNRLERLTGTWDSHVKFYFDAAAPAMEKSGQYTAKLDLGGYFLTREFKVTLDDAGDFTGLAFHGCGLTGYDPFKQQYLGVWVDSGSPALYRTEGTFNAAGDIFTEISEGPDPSGNPMRMRMVTEVKQANEIVFKLYRLGEDGLACLVTEMTHRRRDGSRVDQ